MARPDRREAIYRFVADYYRREGSPPTLEEIAAHLGLKALSNVHRQLGRLVRDGRLVAWRRKYIPSLLAEGGKPARVFRVPVLGRVAAGQPILAVEDLEGHVPYIPQGSEDPAGLFALRVRGDSMVDAGILDGDMVVVESTPVVENGEIAVVLLDNEATVKRLFRENGRFRLQPENARMAPVYVKDLTVLGRVIASSRSYRR